MADASSLTLPQSAATETPNTAITGSVTSAESAQQLVGQTRPSLSMSTPASSGPPQFDSYPNAASTTASAGAPISQIDDIKLSTSSGGTGNIDISKPGSWPYTFPGLGGTDQAPRTQTLDLGTPITAGSSGRKNARGSRSPSYQRRTPTQPIAPGERPKSGPGSRGGRGSRGGGTRSYQRKNTAARELLQSPIDDEFVDVESVDSSQGASPGPVEFKPPLPIDLKGLPTNLPIYQFQHFQRDIGDSDDDDDISDSLPIADSGAFTAEEIMLILKTKWAQLQGLYEEAREDMKDTYIHKRSQYVRNQAKLYKSKVPFTSNPDFLVCDESRGIGQKFIQDEHEQYKFTQKLLKYHKHNGQRAVLHKMASQKFQEMKEKEKKAAAAKAAGLDPTHSEHDEQEVNMDESDLDSYREFCEAVRELKTQEHAEPAKELDRCEYAGQLGNEPRCTDAALPLTKFCHAHSLNAPKQHLFRPCGRQLASGSTCDIPVLGLIDKLGCPMHHMPVVRDLSESAEAKKELESNIAAQPKERSQKKTIPNLEKLVVDAAVSVDHMREMIEKNKTYKYDTDDSEEIEDELAALPPGPGYMGTNL